MKISKTTVKKINVILFSAVTAAVIFSCGRVKVVDPSLLEGSAPTVDLTASTTPGVTPTPSIDDSTYPFETAADLVRFSITNISDNLRFTAIEISTEKFYKGSASAKITVNYNAGNSGGVISMTGTAMPMTGKTITAHVYIPNGMFTTTNPYGTSFFIQLPNYDWYQSAWANLSLPSGTVPGLWNTVSAKIDDMTLANGNGTTHINGMTLSQNNENGNTAVIWGLKVGQGGTSANYSGFIYIDSITIQ